MTTQTLSRVTLETLENYRTAATQAVTAYRLGSHRLVNVVNGALKKSVYPRTAKMAPRATDRMNEVRGNVSKIFVNGIDQVTERTERAIELSSTTAAAQVSKVAKFAAGIDNQILAGGLQGAARLAMPGAKLGLVLSSKVAEGASALADAAGRRAVHKAAPVARKAKSTVKAATRRVAKTTKAPVAKARRAVRSAKKAVSKVAAA